MKPDPAAPVYLNALGIINALGNGADAIVRAIASGVSPGMGPLTTLLAERYVGQAPALPDWNDALRQLTERPGQDAGFGDGRDTGFVPGRDLETTALETRLRAYDCRHNRMLFAALLQILPAVREAIALHGAGRVGVVLGTSTSGIEAAERAFCARAEDGTLPSEFDYRQMEIGSAGPLAAAALGIRGPAYTMSTACTSSGKAIASARRLLRLGLCDAVVTGGVDSLCELTLQGFASLESISDVRCNPMSANRAGINIGEGAAVFLMSREPGRVWLAGIGESSDAYHISAPDPDGAGAEIALRAALEDAGIAAGDIAYVNLHATATPKNDDMEAHLMARVFPDGVPTSGTKPLTGHQLGAAAAAELGLLWLMLTRADMPIPPHRWDAVPDPALPRLQLVVPGTYLQGPGTHAPRFLMSNSFAFGGSNLSVIVGDRP